VRVPGLHWWTAKDAPLDLLKDLPPHSSVSDCLLDSSDEVASPSNNWTRDTRSTAVAINLVARPPKSQLNRSKSMTL